MNFDQDSLLLALSFSGVCLSATLFGCWLMAKAESFLITWAVGVLLIVGSTFTYQFYGSNLTSSIWMVFYLLLAAGLSTLIGAVYHFRTGQRPFAMIALAFGASSVVGLPAAILGYSGLATIILTIVCAALLFAAAWEHWKGRQEAPGAIAGLAALYSAIALSFVLCAGVLVANGELVLDHRPSNWAEDVNLVVSIAGMTGIGALSLALNQARVARSHRRDALTDAMTGLMNRRALFERHGDNRFGSSMAVILFDLDNFKMINDRYGHAAGDKMLVAFAEELVANCRSTDTTARFGGEEFAVVMGRTLPEWAEQTAERIRRNFADRSIIIDGNQISCTASAGIAFGTQEGLDLDAMLCAADKALYSAKRNGRNRVAVSDLPRAV